jgi:hypothetical protein
MVAATALLAWNGADGGSLIAGPSAMERVMTKPMKQQEMEEKAKKKPGGQQHPNPPRKTSTDNPERNPRDQKGRGGSK